MRASLCASARVCGNRTDNPVCSHTVNLILFISFSGEGAIGFFFTVWACLRTWCWCVRDLDTLVSWFTPPNKNKKKQNALRSSAYTLLALAEASQSMCWLQGPAHIHMFPVCLAQQDTGWFHALLIIPTAQALQGQQPNSIFQNTLVNIMVSADSEMWYYERGRQTVQSAVRNQLLLRARLI